MFYIKPKRAYCRKHGIEYSGYMCPECRMEMEQKSHSETIPEVKHNTKISDEVLEKTNQLGNKKPVEKEKSPPKPPHKRELGNIHERGRYSKGSDAGRQGGTKEKTSSGNSLTKGKKGLSTKPPTKIPSWLFALLLIFALSILGLGLNALTNNSIPLWLLLGFSIIFPIEKWFRKAISRKSFGKLYRLVLNLGILSTLGLLIWSGFQLVAKQLASTPLISSSVFLAELVFFIWMWKKVAKNSWRWPSMKLTISLLVCIAIIFTFAGVPPLSIYKDNLVVKWEEYQTEQAGKEAEIVAEQQRQLIEREAQEAIRVEEERIAQEEAERDRMEEKLRQEIEQQRLVSVEHFATLFNEYRRSYGLSTLTFTDDLNKMAALRLPELELDFSHNSLGNYNLHLAENITWASYTLDNNDAFLSWCGSPGHNANMLDVGYKYTGYAIGGGYAVQLFTEYPTINGEPQLPPGWYWDD